MTDNEALNLKDALDQSLMEIKGVYQALSHVTKVSTDYELCQTLSGVLDTALERITSNLPEELA